MATRARAPRRVVEKIEVYFLNASEGAGWGTPVETEKGTTVEQFLETQISDFDPENFQIRVDNRLVPPDQILEDGQDVTALPTNIDGASR